MLSIVLATYNEAKNIKRCLDSVKGLADEIIVVDGESSDDTKSIARSFGAKVFSTSNKPIFHINKQMAMDKAKGDLILQLDADEKVDHELREFIQETHTKIIKKKQLPAAWSINRKNFFLGKFLKKGGQYPDSVIRLYQKGKARLPQKDVHEQMIVDGEVAVASGHLLHYSNPTFSEYLTKWNRYTTLKASLLKKEGVKPSVGNTLKYFFILPTTTFVSLFFRHKGFVDGYPGFVFALFSGLYHSTSYLKLLEQGKKR